MPLDFATIAALTKACSQKAAAILSDDVAVNTAILQETEPKRRIPSVLKVAGGSLAINAAMIPVALGISAFAPWAILPMLAVAGWHLATEGAEKLRGEKEPNCDDHAKHGNKAELCPERPKTPAEIEKEKVKEALVMDGVLTAEITVLTLAATAGAPILTVLGVLAATGIIRTGWMYGVIAGLTNMDTAGKWLSERKGDGLISKAARGFGKGLDKAAPYIMKGISLVGTLALFLIGGELMLHGIPGAEHMVSGALASLGTNPIVQFAASHIVEGVAGLAAGFASLPVMEKYIEPALGWVKNGVKSVFEKIMPKRLANDNSPQPQAAMDQTSPDGKVQALPKLSPIMNEAATKTSPETEPAQAAAKKAAIFVSTKKDLAS